MKILVIFTGGTIGSVAKDGIIGTDSRTNYTLIRASRYDAAVFDTCAPYTVLSEQLSSRELNLLQETIQTRLHDGYAGIIVTHGTDTLQYTAAALEYAFGDTLPIVLVSADFPLDHPRTNGHQNFEAAVELIRAGQNGVFVSHRNEGAEKTDLHIASRLLAHGECSAELFSLDGVPYATYDGRITVHGEYPNPKPHGVVRYSETSGILFLTSAPGDSFSYSLETTRAVIVKPYHSATLNTASVPFKAFCARAKARGIPVYAVNVKDGDVYESTTAFSDLGIRVLPYSTAISVYMTLWAECSKTEEKNAV